METFTKQEVITAIQQWLEAGEVECNRTNGKKWGYFSGGGLAARTLRYHLETLQQPVEADAESRDEFDFRHSIVCNCFVCRKRHRTA